MAPWVYPHTFHDGTGETASGVQVDDNFTKVREKLEALEALVAGLKSGFVTSGSLAPPTNTHQQIPGSSLVTPAIVSGQRLNIFASLAMSPSGNQVFGSITLDGAEVGANANAAAAMTQTLIWSTTATGVHTIAVNAWATSSVGSVNAFVGYEILNA